ncbi:MAG: aa3-type cytochrome oxidase subunit CtaJ [Pseudonocardiaceae bacterium]
MTSWEIILVLAGSPLAIMALLGLLTLGPSVRRRPRYRPGQEWNHPPVWWTADPQALRDAGAAHHNPATTRAARGGCRGDW